MPLIFRNRAGNGVDARLFYEYMADFDPFIEYKCNEASGNLINSGSEGSAYDLTPAGVIGYQAGNSEAYLEAATEYYINAPGGAAGFHVGDATAVAAKGEGAIVIVFRNDVLNVAAYSDLLTMKPEVGVAEYFQIALPNGTGGTLIVDLNNGTDRRAIQVGNVNWNPFANDNTVHHVLVVQYDASNALQVYLDGVRIDRCPHMTFDITTGSGGTMWWDDINLEVIGLMGRAEYDGLGAFSSISNGLDGRIEYCGFFANSFTFEELDEIFERYVGAYEVVENPEGIDLTRVIHAVGPGTNGNFYYWLERRNQRWIQRNQSEGFCQSLMWAGSEYDSGLNGVYLHPKGYAMVPIDGTLVNQKEAMVLNEGFAYHDYNLWNTGSSEAMFFAKIDPNSGLNAGVDMVAIGALAPTFSSRFLVAIWIPATEVWTNLPAGISTQPTRYVAGGGRENCIAWNDDSSYAGLATLSQVGDNPATGGGCVHLHSVAGTGAAYVLTRQALSGYTPTAIGARGIVLSTIGSRQFAFVFAEGNGAMGITGEYATSKIAVFELIAGTWTANATVALVFNNGVDPAPGSADRILAMHTKGDDIYIGYWAFAGGPNQNNFVHLRWNGTYFAVQTAPAWPPFDDDAATATPTSITTTRDGRGMLVNAGGYVPGTNPRILVYDRATDGSLSYRSGDINDSYPTQTGQEKYEGAGVMSISDSPWFDDPDGAGAG